MTRYAGRFVHSSRPSWVCSSSRWSGSSKPSRIGRDARCETCTFPDARPLAKGLVFAASAAAVALVSFVQNALEDNTNFPALLKAPASDGENPLPEHGDEALGSTWPDGPPNTSVRPPDQTVEE